MSLKSTPEMPSSKSNESLMNLKTQRDRKLLEDAIQQCHNKMEYDRSLSPARRLALPKEIEELKLQLLNLPADV